MDASTAIGPEGKVGRPTRHELAHGTVLMVRKGIGYIWLRWGQYEDLRKLMSELRLTQTRVAEAAGCTRMNVSYMLGGKRGLRLDVLVQLVAALRERWYASPVEDAMTAIASGDLKVADRKLAIASSRIGGGMAEAPFAWLEQVAEEALPLTAGQGGGLLSAPRAREQPSRTAPAVVLLPLDLKAIADRAAHDTWRVSGARDQIELCDVQGEVIAALLEQMGRITAATNPGGYARRVAVTAARNYLRREAGVLRHDAIVDFAD